VNIGLLTTSFPRHAGDYAGSFVGDRLQRLLAEGHRVEVLAACAAGDVSSVTVDGRLTVRRVPASPALFYREGAPEALERGGAIWLAAAQFSVALAAAARKGRGGWDAIESHWLVPSALAASAVAPALPRRAFAHSGDVALLERIPFGRTIARRLAGDGTELRFVSADLQERFARLCGQTANVGNIGNVGTVETLEVPAALFSPRAAPDASLRRRLGLAAPTVLAVGRLVPIKGHAALLHGCARARAWSTAARRTEVVILGDGPERARLIRLAAALEVPLRLVGTVPRAEVADWMRAADLFAHPSGRLANGRTEGAPIAAREARAIGIPVVVTNEIGALARAIGELSAPGVWPACNGSVSGV
jgi:glycosyltransferase involved in cell wall biosynthesis